MSVTNARKLLVKTRAAINAGKERIAALDPDLRPDARQERIAAIRADTVKTLAPLRSQIRALVTDANVALPDFDQATRRRHAKFSADPATDAQQRLAALGTLERTGTGEILDHIEDAIRERNIAKAELCRLEFMRRADRQHFEHQFTTLFRDVVDHEAQAREAELRQTIGVAALANVFLNEFASGKSAPIDRMTAARAAGPAGLFEKDA